MSFLDFKESSKRIITQGTTAGVILYSLLAVGILGLLVIGLLLLFK